MVWCWAEDQEEHKQVHIPLSPASQLSISHCSDADQNTTQEIQRIRETTLAEKIAQLEQSKGALITKRIGLEKKIRKLEIRAQGSMREESMVRQERRR